MIKCLVISDTHGFHEQVRVPDGTEMIIHCGDASNHRDPGLNYNEMLDFFRWYWTVPVKYKIYVPGNHDTSLEAGMFKKFDFGDITFVNHETIDIEGIKIFGSPYTPDFGTGWAYNRKREKLHKYWVDIPENTDILVTHGPPKAILDISEDRDRKMEYCGDSTLRKCVEKINPKFHCFGHIHDYQNHVNHGIRKIGGCDTIFVNASLVEDGKFSKGLIHQGITIEL